MVRAFMARCFVLLCMVCGTAFAQQPVETDGATSAHTSRPTEYTMRRAASAAIDLRLLRDAPPRKRERPEREGPEPEPMALPAPAPTHTSSIAPGPTAPAPAPIANFAGLDFANWGAGHPPDTNGDVGPTYFIQSINSSLGVYRKSDGVRVAAFTFDTFMSQGSFGNLCDTDNFGDPVVLYDTFEDRWIITDFAFVLDGSGNVVNPPGAFQCFAVSQTGDPVSGGWNFYSIAVSGGLDDYPKFGVWTDGIYMSANMFGYAAGAAYQGPRVYALNKAQMYAGSPTVQIVSFEAPDADFTLLPANARLQTGTPPPGTPNFYVSTWQFLNAVTVYKFHVDWNRVSTSTFTGPNTPLASSSWPNASVPNAPSLGGNALDVLQIRAMMQNQYTNIGAVESLWTAHTVRRANTTGFAAPRWYQIDVTGGAVAATIPQAATWDPDAANVLHRFMPSVAVDRAGDMALGYSTSSSTTKPAIQYAGRLAGDPVNTFSQTEQLLIQGAGTQTGNCGGVCARWGDYSAMTLDTDGCTFWYTNEYYAVDGLDHQTRIGSFAFPSCTPLGAGGTLSGTVTAAVGGAPIGGATVSLGSRTAITDGAGFYSFSNLPAGTYPSISTSAPGYDPSTVASIVVSDGNTTTQNFSLGSAATAACPIDTTQADFQTGIPTNADLVVSPGNVLLTNVDNLDQLNENVSTSGFGFNSTTWAAQTFTAALSGSLTKVDLDLFCSGCTGTSPNLIVSIRATAGSPALPTGADLASATIAGFNSGAGSYFSATFASPTTVVAGTRYAIVIRASANPSAGTYAYVVSTANPYLNGQRTTSTNSGGTWTADTTSGGRDLGFHTYINNGYSASGKLVSALKDSNPASGFTPSWSMLSWTGTTPANTALMFQAAASNSPAGPFNFVGPDGTAATFFTGGSGVLTQFDGNRYLRYTAFLSTADGAVTPVLNDATVCYEVNGPPPDLAIIKSDAVATAVPGASVTYTITASNTSTTTPAVGAVVADEFPAVETCTWTCSGSGGGTCSVSGVGDIDDSVDLPVGASVTYTATCSIAADATGTLSNTATVTYADDPNPANDSATDSDALTAEADLSITKTDGVSSVIPGGSTIYTIVASNAGPSDAPGAAIDDTFPPSATCTWTCAGAGGGACTATGADDIHDTADLPSGGSVTYTASCAISLGASGTLVNTATVSAPAGVDDGVPANNSATDSDTIAQLSADLAITKTDGVTSVQTGGSVVYTIVASNAGPDAANGALISDTFSGDLTCASWTCSGANGGTCTANGNGNIADSANLPAGASVTYVADCTIASTSASTTLVNTATVAVPSGIDDPNPGNDSATDTDALLQSLDASITKSDGVTSAVPGNPLTYTIVAANAGPNTADVTVADTFPAALTNCAWTCLASNGSCTGAGSGNIADTGTIAAGGTLTYTASCTVSSTATGSLANTATVTVAGTQVDTNPANNSATDTDMLAAQADFGVSIDDSRDYVSVGDSLDYVIVVSNAGPSAGGVSVDDALPNGLGAASWVCTQSAGATCSSGTGPILHDDASLPPGGQVTYVYSATLQTEDAGVLANSVSVTAAGGAVDPVAGNDSASDTDVIVIFRDGFEGEPVIVVGELDTLMDFTQAEIVVDRSWLDRLSFVPKVVFSGAGTSRVLFQVELLRLNGDLAMRVVTRDARGMSERTAWRAVSLDDAIIDFAWQAASSATPHDGYLVLHADGIDAATLQQRWERDTVVRLRVPLDARGIPAAALTRTAH